MPIYSFVCNKCKETFDLLVGVNQGAAEQQCPACQSADIAKQLSVFSVGSSQKPALPSCAQGCPSLGMGGSCTGCPGSFA